MSLLDRVFRRRARDLEGARSATRVRLWCDVASPNDTVSPVTGLRSALVRWSLLEERSHHGGRGGGVITKYRVLEQGVFCTGGLLLAHGGRTIEVPLRPARLVLIEDEADGRVLDSVPPELAQAVTGLRTTKPIAYREAVLVQGDRVELTATLEPVAFRPGGYREGGRAGVDFRALANERVVVRDVDTF